MRVALRPRARADLEDIWTYTAGRWGLDQAERYLRGIQTVIESLADAPERGRSCADIRPGYRRQRVGSHVIFYRSDQNGVDVVRVLHVGMDATAWLADGS